MRYETDSIVIRRAPFSESSQILHLLTQREGLVSGLARGSYRQKSNFGGAVDLLTRGRVDASRRKATELELIHSFTVTHPYRGLRTTMLQWTAANYLLELVRRFSWPRDQENALFLLLAEALDAVDLATSDELVATWLVWYVARLTARVGFRPVLDRCVACSSMPPTDDRARFSVAQGGVLCGRCAHADRQSVSFRTETLTLLERLLDGKAPNSPRSGALTLAHLAEARQVLDQCLEHRLERRLLTCGLLDGILQ